MRDPKISVTQEFLKLIAEIDEFKGEWEALKNMSPERLRQLRKVATIESIGSSTRIEGAKLTDMQVETLLSNLASTSFKSRDEQEVVGYAEAMDIVFQAYEDMTITENHIRQLHQTLLRHSKKDERHRGDYKKFSNRVVAFDECGKEIGVIFETTAPFDTSREMEELVHWVNKAIAENSIHPLLTVGVFVVVFLAIHPFQDGNGRLSRILTTLILLRTGYLYVPYISLESIIEDNKDLYYKALRRTQATLKSDHPDWEPWLSFFLRCLKKQKSNLAAKVKKEKALDDTTLPALSIQILELLKQHGRLTIAEMVEHTAASQSTIKVRLRELISMGRIQRYGKARATWYAFRHHEV
jgi:Fic family protein